MKRNISRKPLKIIFNSDALWSATFSLNNAVVSIQQKYLNLLMTKAWKPLATCLNVEFIKHLKFRIYHIIHNLTKRQLKYIVDKTLCNCVYVCVCSVYAYVYTCVHCSRLVIKYHHVILQVSNYTDLMLHSHLQNKQTNK